MNKTDKFYIGSLVVLNHLDNFVEMNRVKKIEAIKQLEKNIRHNVDRMQEEQRAQWRKNKTI